MEDMTGVLIVEDQFLVALDLEHIVASAGYPVVSIATARSEIDEPLSTAIGFIQKPLSLTTIESAIGYALGAVSAPSRRLQVLG